MTAREIIPACPSAAAQGGAPVVPALIAAAGDHGARRFLELFTATIRNAHTRRAYGRPCGEFLAWCAGAGVRELAEVQPLHVATWIEMQTHELAAPSVKQRLAAVRHLFDWLVTGQVVPVQQTAIIEDVKPACRRRRLRDEARQPQLPGDRDYNGGTLEKAASMANHVSTRARRSFMTAGATR